MRKESLKIGAYTVEISNLNKVLFPDDGITKGEFIEYHRRMSPLMVPLIKGRPLNMHRFPDGIDKEGFFQQSAPDYLPDWIDRVQVEKSHGKVTHIVCNNAASLVYLANQVCITPHVWLSREEKLEKPDQMIFDLDPPGDDFEKVRQGAKYLKDLLQEIGLFPFLKTTGSNGLHVVVPLKPVEDFDGVREVARNIADIMTKREPSSYTTEQRKEKRRNRLFIDVLRNSYGQTAVAPYAVRAKKGAPVAIPLFWEELEEPDLTSQKFNIRNIFKHLEEVGEPWKDLHKQSRSLQIPRQRIKGLRA